MAAPDALADLPGTARTIRMRVVAQDPSVRVGQRHSILTSVVDVPAEELAPGPRGYRVHLIDYDATSQLLYPPFDTSAGGDPWVVDPTAEVSDDVILEDPRFHARNTYALVMRTLARFEYALGRRVSWGFESSEPGHQIKVAPHAFCEPNAYYSRRDEALLFGYFPTRDGRRHVFTCLSHDIVAHETAHALLDGLRTRFVEPSSQDQAAFHEGFADVVALLSVFAQREVVTQLMDARPRTEEPQPPRPRAPKGVLLRGDATADQLRRSVLFGLAEQFGRETGPIGRSALRHSALLSPDEAVGSRFTEAHDRGELLVAAIANAFIDTWAARLQQLFRDPRTRFIDRGRAAEEGARAADYLLTLAIRAIDYTPPVHLEFGTYLSALLTADREVRPTDELGLRASLRSSFLRYGVQPAANPGAHGMWLPPSAATPPLQLSYDRTRFESMQRDRDEVFRFAWENRRHLSLAEGAYTRVISVRPCFRFAPEDGFVLRETVAEVLQQLSLPAGELGRYGIEKPKGMPDGTQLMLFGGVTLIFDEYGKVKYAVGDAVYDPKRPAVQQRQGDRLRSLWIRGHFSKKRALARRFAALHRQRALAPMRKAEEQW